LCVVNLNDAGIELAQRWLDDARTNHGVIIADYDQSDSVQFDSRYASTPGNRPKLTVLVSAAPGSARVTGQSKGLVETGYTFTVTVGPATAALPITYVWQTTDQAAVTHPDHVNLTDTQIFSWAMAGPKAITVTATNDLGSISDTHVITIYTPVHAAFTASPTLGVAPLTVAFTNTSSGDYAASLWHFGDGVSSTRQSPTHTYMAAGAYTTTLTVSGPGGVDTETKAEYITVRNKYRFYLPIVVRRP
jgi:PKD repeat protein